MKVLGDYFSLQRGNTYKSNLLGKPGPVLLGLGSIARNGGFKGEKLKTYGGPSDPRMILGPGDIFVSLKDVTQSADLLGAVARVPSYVPQGRLTQDTVKLVFKEADSPKDYLYWLLQTPDYRAYCRAHSTGTTNLGLAREDFLAFPVPDLTPARQWTVNIVQRLDDKIELNRRMNETLEAMAQAIFRDWFVDFGPTRRKIDGATDPVEIMGGLVADPDRARELAELFPARLGDDGLPVGWVERKLDEIASQHNATLTPLDHPTELFDHYSIPSFDKERNPTTELGAAILSNKTLVPSNAVLLSKLNPEIARVWLPNKDARHREICSTEFLAYTSKEPFGRALLYALFSSDPFRTLLCGMVTGTSKSHQRVSPKALAQRETLAVRGPEATQFEAVVGPLLDRVLHNRDENRTLAATRDLLLPKLMSGEIRVRDAEAELEAAQ